MKHERQYFLFAIHQKVIEAKINIVYSMALHQMHNNCNVCSYRLMDIIRNRERECVS